MNLNEKQVSIATRLRGVQRWLRASFEVPLPRWLLKVVPPPRWPTGTPRMVGRQKLQKMGRLGIKNGKIAVRYSTVFALIIVLTLGPLAYLSFKRPKKVAAAWFNDNWGYHIKAVGNYQGGSQNWGTVDQVLIYNYALTATQIKQLFNAGSAVYFGPASGPP